MHAQAVGAYGEKVVEAELLRHGWIPSNVNASIKNAVDFDIFAVKRSRAVQIRVKACGPGWRAFQFGGFRPGHRITTINIRRTDFTVLVEMGKKRGGDNFYIIPTEKLRKQIAAHRDAYLRQRRRDRGKRKDLGMWTLHLNDLRSGEERFDYGFAKKWKRYLGNWRSLIGR